MSDRKYFNRAEREEGFVLVVILLLLVAIAILGLLNSSNALMQTRMARAEREYQNAYAGAESALADGEREIIAGTRRLTLGSNSEIVTSSRIGPAFTSLSGSCDSSGTLTASQSGVGLGLYDMTNCPTAWWLNMQFTSTYSQILGGVTGVAYPLASSTFLAGSSAAPRYVIDILPDNTPGQSASPNNRRQVFRITSRGVGSSSDTEVVLQSVIRRLD